MQIRNIPFPFSIENLAQFHQLANFQSTNSGRGGPRNSQQADSHFFLSQDTPPNNLHEFFRARKGKQMDQPSELSAHLRLHSFSPKKVSMVFPPPGKSCSLVKLWRGGEVVRGSCPTEGVPSLSCQEVLFDQRCRVSFLQISTLSGGRQEGCQWSVSVDNFPGGEREVTWLHRS